MWRFGVWIVANILLLSVCGYRLPNDFEKELRDVYTNLKSLYESTQQDERVEASVEKDPLKLPEDGNLFEGDMIMDARLRKTVRDWNSDIGKKSAIVPNRNHDIYWKDGIVPYVIDVSFTSEARDLLKIAINEFLKRTCIKLIPRTDEKDYVIYTSSENTCSSHVGRIGGPQKIYIGRSCGVLGTVEHETMHALGFIHEHSRPDRDDFIKVIIKNVKEDDAPNFQKYSFNAVNDLEVDYNFMSVMHYRADAFSKNGQNTIVPKHPEPSKVDFGQRIMFSEGDVRQINRLYQCEEKPKAYAGLIKDYAGYEFEKRKRKDQERKIQRDRLYNYRNIF